MRTYSLSHLSDGTLLDQLKGLVAQDRLTTAELLAHVAEVDERKLYLPAGFPSMFAYCAGELHLSEDAAAKRIQAARAARRFPAILDALARGRLHLSAVVLLAPYLTEDTAEKLLVAATHKSKAVIERLLAERFPRSDVFAWVQGIPVTTSTLSAEEHAPGHADGSAVAGPMQTQQPAGFVAAPARVKPLSGHSFHVEFTLSRRAHEKLQYAQDLLSHAVPAGDVAGVLERALDVLIPKLERQKFAAAHKPRAPRDGSSANPRHIPAHVKRAVWGRDGGQCTFVSDSGRRCGSRGRLEFDHVLEMARGGEATVAGLRLRCRAHNQFTAERTFGPGFMDCKRREARHTPERARASSKHAPGHVEAREAEAGSGASAKDRTSDLVACLRTLGFGAGEVRQAATCCERVPGASLEAQVRAALAYLRPPRGSRPGATPSPVACSAS